MKNTQPKRCGQYSSGFTLVELMIVIFILGLMAGAVVITLPASDRVMTADAEKFAAKVAALRDNAILQSRPMAIQVTASGYSFAERRKGSWQVLGDKPFLAENWSQGVRFANMDDAPMLISFESTGLPSESVQLRLAYEGKEQAVHLDQLGNVTLGNDIKADLK